MFLPKPGSDILVTSRSSSDRGFLFVNSRPVTIKEIEKVSKKYTEIPNTDAIFSCLSDFSFYISDINKQSNNIVWGNITYSMFHYMCVYDRETF